MKPGKFPAGLGGFNMNSIMQQAQKMQKDMLLKKEELDGKEYTATVGGGAVTVTLKGSTSVSSLKISPKAVDPSDVEMLEDMIVAAFNEALKTAKDTEATELKSVTGGIDMPL